MAISHGAIGWSTCIANSSLLHDDLIIMYIPCMYLWFNLMRRGVGGCEYNIEPMETICGVDTLPYN